VRKLISGLLAFMMGKAQFPERLMWQVVQGMYKALLWLAGKADIIITRFFKAIWGEEGVEIWNEFKKAISLIFRTLVEQAPALASAVAELLPPLLRVINGIANFIGWLSDLHPSLGTAGLALLLFWDKIVGVGKALLWLIGKVPAVQGWLGSISGWFTGTLIPAIRTAIAWLGRFWSRLNPLRSFLPPMPYIPRSEREKLPGGKIRLASYPASRRPAQGAAPNVNVDIKNYIDGEEVRKISREEIKYNFEAV